jgi:hypothetical protein
MELELRDATGRANGAKIDSTNRLWVRSSALSQQLEAACNGDSFQLGSGVVTITSASESAVLYVKNNEDEDLLLTGINITSKSMTGSTDDVALAKLYTSNPTGLSSSTSQTPLNNNFGSSKALDADVESGGNAVTVTGGSVTGAFYIPVNTFFNTEIAWVLPRGTSVAVSFTAGSGTTAWPVTVTLEGHLGQVENK